MKFVTSMFYGFLLLPLAIYSQMNIPIQGQASTEKNMQVNSLPKAYLPENSTNTHLYYLPPDTHTSGAAMIGIDGKITGDMLYAQKKDNEDNLTGNLVLIIKDSGKITLTPMKHEDVDKVLAKTKFYDKKNNIVALNQGNVLAMWQEIEGDKLITQSLRKGIRFTAFQKNEAGEKAHCICRINTQHE
jgi:hypothetical protein